MPFSRVRLKRPARPSTPSLWVAVAIGALGAPGFAAEGRNNRPEIRIVLVGDSTVTDRVGWAGGFRRFLREEVDCVNTARGGRSSKSFLAEGRWEPALQLRGDFYLIQFGHNDVPGKGPARETDPATTYAANLTRYVADVRKAGGQPILVTPLAIRTFDRTTPEKLASGLAAYAAAARKVATEEDVPLIDLDAESRAFCERLGPEEVAKFNPTRRGKADPVHLNTRGSLAFARIVVEQLKERVPALAPYLRSTPRPTLDAAFFTDVPYAPGREDLLLDVSVPEGPGPFPVAMLVNGNTAEDALDAQRLGDAMDVAPWWRILGLGRFTRVLVNYRPDSAERDIMAAIDWVHAHAADYKGDPRLVMLCGHDAGAVHALRAALHAPQATIAAVAATAPDWRMLGDAQGRMVATESDLPPDFCPNGVQLLLMHGTRDNQVPLSASEAFSYGWRRRGGVCELVSIPGGTHSLTDWWRCDPAFPEKILNWLARTAATPIRQ